MSIDREGWQTGLIPCDGWYYLEPWDGEESVWLQPIIDAEGYHVVWSSRQEGDDPESLALAMADEGTTIDQVRWRHDMSRMSPMQAEAFLDALRSVPNEGAWGVLGSYVVDDELHWDGCRPMDWRPTKEQATELAHVMREHYIGQVVRRGRHGWSIGEVHRITAGWMTFDEIAALWSSVTAWRVESIASQLGLIRCARHYRHHADPRNGAVHRLSPAAVGLVERELQSRGYKRADR